MTEQEARQILAVRKKRKTKELLERMVAIAAARVRHLGAADEPHEYELAVGSFLDLWELLPDNRKRGDLSIEALFPQGLARSARQDQGG